MRSIEEKRLNNSCFKNYKMELYSVTGVAKCNLTLMNFESSREETFFKYSCKKEIKIDIDIKAVFQI